VTDLEMKDPSSAGLNVNKKRSVTVCKKRTSISLEDSFWQSLHAIVRMENTTVSEFVGHIAVEGCGSKNLSSCLRSAILQYFQNLAAGNIGVRSDAGPGQHKVDGYSWEQDQKQMLERIANYWRKVQRDAYAQTESESESLAPTLQHLEQ
jgi:predicted DNA-binding ribbon-helix-helix protein